MNDQYAAQIDIDRFMAVEHADYVQHAIEHMKRDGAIKVFDEIYKHGSPVVVETHLEQWEEWDRVRYRLHYRLTAVQMRNVTMYQMPEFEFINHSGVREWKCPACGMINVIDATFCGEKHKNAAGCGRPRNFARE